MWCFLLFLLFCLFLSIRGTFEGLKASSTLCGQRSTCQQCHNDGKSPNGVCYWCKDKGCQSPDDYYDPNTCSSDLADCQVSATSEPKKNRG